MRRVLQLLVMTTVCAVGAPTVHAQSQPSSIPTGLVLALLGGPGGHDGTSFSVGAAPNGVPAEYIPPAPVSTVGGWAAGGARTVVFAYPNGGHDSFESYVRFLRGKGWTAPNEQPMRGGFVSSEEASPRMGWLCRDSGRVSILPALGAPAGVSWVKASFYRDAMHPSCTEQPVGNRQQEEFNFPPLLPPPGLRLVGGTSGGGGMGSRSTSTRLRASLPIADVLTHYTAQLQKAGWTIGDRLMGSGTAVQTVEAPGREGEPWKGTFSVLTVGKELYLELQMVKVAQ